MKEGLIALFSLYWMGMMWNAVNLYSEISYQASQGFMYCLGYSLTFPYELIKGFFQ